jgi:hypothetical protein
MLYGHYTTANALINIVQTETLWATNIKFLNDEQEFLHAIDLAKDVIKRSTEKSSGKIKSNKMYYDAFVEETTKAIEDLDRYNSESVFTCSFSEEKDLLSQWRGYCPNNQGYCIHFDLEGLLAFAKKKFLSCELFPCVYDDDKKVKSLSDLLNKYWQIYISQSDPKVREATIRKLAQEVEALASHFKHSSFAEEKEHRLVILMAWDFEEHGKFRSGPMSIIPYIEIPAPIELIKQVCIGPTRDQNLAKRGLAALMDFKFGSSAWFSKVEISRSKIPYRL